MRKVSWAVLAACLAGCAGVTKEELDVMRREIKAASESSVATLRGELTGIDQKYVKVQQLDMEIRKKMEDIDKLQKQLTETGQANQSKIEAASTTVVRMLEFEEKLLAERLATVRAMLAELKK